MQQLAEETGGAYFEAGSSNSLEKIYARIQDELRNQYNLGYTSDQHGPGYRAIRVSVKRRNLKVQARQGYYAR
jgi:VWFA-related protein